MRYLKVGSRGANRLMCVLSMKQKSTENQNGSEIPDMRSASFYVPVKACLDFFPKRTRDIVGARFGFFQEKVAPLTLDAVGKNYFVTRERIRQIIEQVFREMHERYADHLQHSIEHILFTVRAKSGIIKEEDLLRILFLDDWRERRAIAFLLEYMRGRFLKDEKRRSLDGIVALADFNLEHFEKTVDFVYQILDQRKSTMPLQEIYCTLNDFGVERAFEELESYLMAASRVQRNAFGDWGIVTWPSITPRGMRDRARLVLSHEGKPVHFREIARKIDEYGLNKSNRLTNVQTVHNELIKDESFVLVGRGMYALREWGFDDGTVKEVIEQVLKQAGKPLSKEEIFERVSKMKNVKKTTVFINLSHFFVRSAKNTYRVKDKQ